jgi:beta-lysine 5,6-aminomutase beta subunit
MTTPIDLSSVRPYGDHLDDGMLHVSFTLPVLLNERGKKAALELAIKMGIERPHIVHCLELFPGFSSFTIYGKCIHQIVYAPLIEDETEIGIMNDEQIEATIEHDLRRPVIIIGATTGSDTHTIGLDSILNMKGFDGEHGLEAFEGFKVFNLGGQVANENLVERVMDLRADVVLVSQTVTQQDLHIKNLTHLVDLLNRRQLRDKVLLICGGHGITDELARELGYDKGFTKGCSPNIVATYIVRELAKRTNMEPAL